MDASVSPFAHRSCPPSYEGDPWQFDPHITFVSQMTPALSLDGASCVPEQAAMQIQLIVEHPRFNTFYVSIKSCLQLPEEAWQKYAQLREDISARAYLESSQPAIWHVPPEDIWISVTRLRETQAFRTIQASVLARVERAYHGGHEYTPGRQLPNFGRYRLSHDSTATAIPGLQVNMEGDDISRQQINMARQAPDGLYYHCPSAGCTKNFKRLGHYERHLKKNHPDFEPCHPGHSALKSLKPRTSSSSSDSWFKTVAQRPGDCAVGSNVNLSVLGNSLASRRGSHVSLRSFTSASWSSSGLDDGIDPPPMDPVSSMTDSVWHMEGATVTDAMNVDRTTRFYTNDQED